ncbi:MAG: VIT and VWA domain-containing protein [Stappiaceae bacterium]
MKLIFATLSLAVFTTLGSALAAVGKTEDAGQVVTVVDGKTVRLPLLRADYDVDIEGSVATVQVTQTFFNPTTLAINATYLFPLNQHAAVFGMQMEVGDELIKATIKKKQEAEATFEKAKAEGKAASLLTQHRPNMFTQNIANLMPGKPVKITLTYVQSVPMIEDAYELVVPLVVGPRYEGSPSQPSQKIAAHGDSEGPSVSDFETISGWNVDKLPDYPNVFGQDTPKAIDPERVSIKLDIVAPMPISAVSSATHALSVEGDETRKSISLAKGNTIDNRDFVLRYGLQDKEIRAGAVSHFDERGGFVSLMIEPPKMPAEETITPRELVFVLDTSGSMNGEPVDASKSFMDAALAALRPTDYFRILRFSDNTSQFAQEAVRATPENIKNGQAFVAGLTAGGGTEMNRAINAAFDTAQPDNTMRIVVFLTDGYIGRENDVIASIRKRIGKARIYAFGVGTSVNRFLLDAMASEGRGYARYVDPTKDAMDVAQTLARDLKSPVLTDISIDWKGLAIQEQAPAQIPDLFAGNSVRVLARYKDGGEHTIHINGLINGRKAYFPVTVSLPRKVEENETAQSPLPTIWAREQIAQKNRNHMIGDGDKAVLERQITKLGLDFSLQSRFTSFVAVSQKAVNTDPERAVSSAVPLSQVAGVKKSAYPSLNLSGSSAPEPESIIGFMMVMFLTVLRFWKRIRAGLVALLSGKVAGRGDTVSQRAQTARKSSSTRLAATKS